LQTVPHRKIGTVPDVSETASRIPESAQRIIDLEERQDEALRQLAELEQKLEAILAAASASTSSRPADSERDAA
jgi:hypothetical protein